MKSTPILFSAPMVRALLDGRKTQTRRVVKPQPPLDTVRARYGHDDRKSWCCFSNTGGAPTYIGCPYGQPGDRLVVKETFRVWKDEETLFTGQLAHVEEDRKERIKARTEYRASSHDSQSDGWRPSIFMPLWLSRLTLETVSVRVERVQEISEEDARAEGVEITGLARWPNAWSRAYAQLWDSINGQPRKGKPDVSWASNCWVWALTFRKLEGVAP